MGTTPSDVPGRVYGLLVLVELFCAAALAEDVLCAEDDVDVDDPLVVELPDGPGGGGDPEPAPGVAAGLEPAGGA